jgi:riboflavin synthase
MFTGIITDVGRIRARETTASGRDLRFVIETAYATQEIALGASICCSGTCLTVVDRGSGWFAVDVSAETLDKTTLGAWQAGDRINLERALRLGDELGGHLVSGHVDGVAEVVGRHPDGDSLRYILALKGGLGRFIAPKGSVALDGVSLTINEVEDASAETTRFGVNIIPHTQQNTTFGTVKPGARVNVEVDMLARYVSRLSQRS